MRSRWGSTARDVDRGCDPAWGTCAPGGSHAESVGSHVGARPESHRRPVRPPRLRSVRGLGSQARPRIEAAQQHPFVSIADAVDRLGLDRRALRALAEAGAFDAFVMEEPPGRRRRVALWRCSSAARGWGPSPSFLRPRSPRTSAPSPHPSSPPPTIASPDSPSQDTRCGISVRRSPRTASARPRALCARRWRARRPCGARDLPPATADGEGVHVPHPRGRDGTINVVVRPQQAEAEFTLLAQQPILLVRGGTPSGGWGLEHPRGDLPPDSGRCGGGFRAGA